MQKRMYQPVRGFTLIEILVVIGMIAVLASIVLVAVNPLRQFAQARNAQRESGVNAILNAVGEHLADQQGVFLDQSTCINDLPASAETIAKGGMDLRSCLIPTYIPELPSDPSTGTNSCRTPDCGNPDEDYDTGYTIVQDPATNRITVCAPNAAEPAINGSAAYCVTR